MGQVRSETGRTGAGLGRAAVVARRGKARRSTASAVALASAVDGLAEPDASGAGVGAVAVGSGSQVDGDAGEGRGFGV